MATEESRLLKKPFDYLSSASITVNSKSKDCIVVLPTVYSNDNLNNNVRFVGLTKEELYIFMDDPWWQQLRRAVLISFWVLLVAIFASSCIISIVEYKQQCGMKPSYSGINASSIDIISRTSSALSTNAMASNTTAIASMINSLATVHQVQFH